ncbi:MAG: response regulator, partial [Acidobacteria bacterium]|nr:response regulator [Acidobacteriota bacterium]
MPESKGSLLLIDDEPEIRESLEMLFSLEGFEIESAANAVEGLQWLERKPFDVVLLDVSLPDKSGLELLPELRAADAS